MLKKCLKWIFQIGNEPSNFCKNKFIIIFGLKFYLAKKQDKMAYYEYLENNLKQDKSDFIKLTNKAYVRQGGGE